MYNKKTSLREWCICIDRGPEDKTTNLRKHKGTTVMRDNNTQNNSKSKISRKQQMGIKNHNRCNNCCREMKNKNKEMN